MALSGLSERLLVCPLLGNRTSGGAVACRNCSVHQPHLYRLSPTLTELHHETLDSSSPHGRRSCDVIPCLRGRQDYRSGPRRLRRWFRMEAGGGHSPESWLLGTSCPGA